MLIHVLVFALFSVTYAQEFRVNTTQGVVIGALAADGNYTTFYGLHYGGSTSGENRFKAPTPPPNYPGDYHAIDNNILCAQPSVRGLIGKEDCLTLNIFTRNLNGTNPVLVWIDGEEYATTSNNGLYSYKGLVEQDLVVVTINYRLSIFGFLCLGVHEAPGNAGLRDIIQGLKWIQQNIAGFGGNPNNVVLLGHGSGAAIVDLITLTPQAVGLFHKAIALSGSAISPWAVAYDPVGYAESLGTRLGYIGKTRAELAKLLVSTDINVLINAIDDFKFTNNTAFFAPCIENIELNPNDTVLADVPINLLRSGNYSQIPYIAAYTDREGTIRAEQAAFNEWLNLMQANFSNFIQVDIGFNSETNKTTTERAIREFYFGQRTINMETIEDYLDYHGDTMILVSVIRGVRERALTSVSPVRLLEFGYRGTSNSEWPYQQIPLKGVRHGGMLNYLFQYDLQPIDENVRRSFVERIGLFAKTGVPEPSENITTWLPITSTLFNYLEYSGGQGPVFNTSIFGENAKTNPHSQRMTFWNDIYFKYYVPPKPVSSAENILSFSILVFLCQVYLRYF